MKPKGILLISGNATSGKDTFFRGLRLIFGKSVERFAFADSLKNDADILAERIFNKKIILLSKEEKEIFRPILVDYGNIMRKVNPLHWVKEVNKSIQSSNDDFDYVVITDCRYENELVFFRENYSCPVKLLYLERYDCLGNTIPPANEIEKENNIKLKTIADFFFSWITIGENNEIMKTLVKDYVKFNMQNFFKP